MVELSMDAASYDIAARKRTVSLTLNSDLYAKVRAAGMNASRIAESALAQALKAREAELLRGEIRQDMKALADYIAEHGDPAAELRELFDTPDAA
jgi:post-segregation antitoxin (ccd killing protein)